MVSELLDIVTTLYQRRMITLEDSMGRSSDPEELRKLIAKHGMGGPAAGRRRA